MGGGSGIRRLPSRNLPRRTIGIVGTRRRDSNGEEDFLACCEVFHSIYYPGDRIVSGGCPKGGDRFAEMIAKANGLTITIHYPDWDKHRKAAGFVRNTLIAEDCDVLIAVVSEDRTGGTEDTIRKVQKMGKPIYLVE